MHDQTVGLKLEDPHPLQGCFPGHLQPRLAELSTATRRSNHKNFRHQLAGHGEAQGVAYSPHVPPMGQPALGGHILPTTTDYRLVNNFSARIETRGIGLPKGELMRTAVPRICRLCKVVLSCPQSKDRVVSSPLANYYEDPRMGYVTRDLQERHAEPASNRLALIVE